jgi:hypothetical protein
MDISRSKVADTVDVNGKERADEKSTGSKDVDVEGEIRPAAR